MRVHMLGPMELFQSLIYVGAVSVFFIVAGFNLKYPINVIRAVKQKFDRLLIPYFCYSVLLLLIEHKYRLDKSLMINFLGILYARMSYLREISSSDVSFLLIGNAPMWFLPCMFLTYLWVYSIYCRCRTIIQKILTCFIFVCFSAILYTTPILFPWSLDTSFLFATLLVFGYEFRDFFFNTKISVVIVAILVWMTSYYFFSGSNISIGEYGEYGILSIVPFCVIAIAETYALCGILQWFQKTYIVKCLAYIGQNSLRLMCIHLIVYNKLIQYLSILNVNIQENKYFVLILAFLSILSLNAFISVVLQKLSEKGNLVAKYL